MKTAQSSVHWKRLMEPPALPGWITLGWKLVGALSNIDYLKIHFGGVWQFFMTPLGNVLLILGGLAWLAAVVFLPRKSIEVIKDDATTKHSEKPKLLIHSALYGVGDASDIQIADRLNGFAREGMVIPVNRSLVSFDPAPGKPKFLKVTYSFDGIQQDPISISEDFWLVLPQDLRLRALRNELQQAETRIATLSKPPDDIHLELLCFQRGTTLSLEETTYFLRLKISCDEDTGIKNISASLTIENDVVVAAPMGDLSEWMIRIPFSNPDYPYRTFKEEEMTSLSLWDELQRDGLHSGLVKIGWVGVKIAKRIAITESPSRVQIQVMKSRQQHPASFIFTAFSECGEFHIFDRMFKQQ
jgi:hypothetical protein